MQAFRDLVRPLVADAWIRHDARIMSIRLQSLCHGLLYLLYLMSVLLFQMRRMHLLLE
jgi:hypothetical protein